MNMAELGVNIDHVATVRQARRACEPDPVWAAVLAQLAGADGITVHLREDRRHIQERDLRILREVVTVKLNLEMSCDPQVLEIACQVKPDQATLVPERREELTTEGGLDVVSQQKRVEQVVGRLREAGIAVSLFLDPDPRQIEAAVRLDADAVELHTGQYALAPRGAAVARGTGNAEAGRPADPRRGHDAARRTRPDLPQRPPRRHYRGDARAEYRSQHRGPGDDGRIRAGGPRDEVLGRLTLALRARKAYHGALLSVAKVHVAAAISEGIPCPLEVKILPA